MSLTDTQQQLIQSTARIQYHELQRFYAQGKLLWGDSNLDLVEVAEQIVRDQLVEIKALQQQQKIQWPSDDDARRWFAHNQWFWSVVVAPYVLVQESDDDRA